MATSLEDLKQNLFPKYPALKQEYEAKKRADHFQEACRYHLQELRLSVGISEQRMASELGVSLEVIQALEKGGTHDLPLNLVFRVAEICGHRPVVSFVPVGEQGST